MLKLIKTTFLKWLYRFTKLICVRYQKNYVGVFRTYKIKIQQMLFYAFSRIFDIYFYVKQNWYRLYFSLNFVKGKTRKKE